MPLYIISYDLNKDKNYDKIIKELKKFNCHKVQRSLWFGNFSDTAKELLDYFKDFVDDDDNLLVAKFSKSSLARKQSLAGTTDWLGKNQE